MIRALEAIGMGGCGKPRASGDDPTVDKFIKDVAA
mgnify:FL=1